MNLIFKLLIFFWGLIWTSSEGAYLTFGNGANSERQMAVCFSPRQACNVLYDRFWLSLKVVRLCKCPDRSQCPSQLSDDRNTIRIGNRIQLKFCSAVGDLPTCREAEIAMETQVKRSMSKVYQRQALIGCHCPQPANHLQEVSYKVVQLTDSIINRTEYYTCQQMSTCKNHREKCGYVRVGTYETHPLCICPQRAHLCANRDRKAKTIALPFYEGPVYTAYCQTS